MSRSKPPRVRSESRADGRLEPKTGTLDSSRRPNRAKAGARRKRQFVAIGSVIASLIFALVIVLVSQPGAAAPGSPNPDRRTIGKPEAPVLITEWSDFQ